MTYKGIGERRAITLTTGVDNIVGTSGNDTIIAAPVNSIMGTAGTTLQGFDNVDGGAGEEDILNIFLGEDATVTFNSVQAGTVKNVEIINIDNRATKTTAFGGAAIDASAFEGAKQIWQIGKETDVVELEEGTTAGFREIAGTATSNTTFTGATANIALDDVGSGFRVNVEGVDVNTINISGSVKAGTNEDFAVVKLGGQETGSPVGSLAKLKTINLDLTSNTELQSFSPAIATVTTINGSDSKGGLNLQLAGLAGNDTLAIANISTGSGDDIVTAAVNATSAEQLTIATKSGDDEVTLSGVRNTGTAVKINANLGDGDDTLDVSGTTLAATDVLVGGAGADTLVIQGGTPILADYLMLSAVASGFETLEAKAATTFDASQVNSQFTTLAFNTGVNEVTKLGTQALVLKAGTSLTATTSGYKVEAGKDTIYSGTVNATTYAATATITANADAVTLNVVTEDSEKAAAVANTAVAATLAGDVQTATINLTSTRDTGVTGISTGFENVAGVTIDLDPSTANVTANNTLNALKSVTITGAGAVVIDASEKTDQLDKGDEVSGKLLNIDLSGMTAFLDLNANGDQQGGAYVNLSTSNVTLNDAKAETISLGGGDDTVRTGSTIGTAGTYNKMDTITGFSLVASAADSKLADAAKSDAIVITSETGAITWKVFEFATTPANFDAALLAVGTSADANLLFQFGGNTYVYIDKNIAGATTDDVLIKLTGTLNLDLLADVVTGLAV